MSEKQQPELIVTEIIFRRGGTNDSVQIKYTLDGEVYGCTCSATVLDGGYGTGKLPPVPKSLDTKSVVLWCLKGRLDNHTHRFQELIDAVAAGDYS